ncbi:MAG: hypothetical protein HY400_02060, partial [Elusimicrobia bacterium]|nr:hypothetical protein [Elusimicrobiota bacterium]
MFWRLGFILFNLLYLWTPVWSNSHTVTSSQEIQGSPELTFTSNKPSITIEPTHPADPSFSDFMQKIAHDHGCALISHAFYVLPDETNFPKPAVLTFKYDPKILEELGIPPSKLEIHESAPTAEGFIRLPTTVDETNHTVTATLSELHSAFGVFGTGFAGDTTPPVTTLEINGPQYQDGAGNKTLSATGSQIALSAMDPVVDGRSSGISFVGYWIDIPPDFSTVTPYQGPFSLSEGIHTVSYFSIDRVGNIETIRSTVLRADGTAPTIVLRSPLGGETFTRGKDKIHIDFSVTDNFDPSP